MAKYKVTEVCTFDGGTSKTHRTPNLQVATGLALVEWFLDNKLQPGEERDEYEAHYWTDLPGGGFLVILHYTDPNMPYAITLTATPL